jgi:hypothetical protein
MTTNEPPGPRNVGLYEYEIVPLSELIKRLGLGVSAIRQARRQGLKIHKIGRKKFVLGRDIVAFLESRPSP